MYKADFNIKQAKKKLTEAIKDKKSKNIQRTYAKTLMKTQKHKEQLMK